MIVLLPNADAEDKAVLIYRDIKLHAYMYIYKSNYKVQGCVQNAAFQTEVSDTPAFQDTTSSSLSSLLFSMTTSKQNVSR